ncbi:P1 family peptidase [Microlunatus soli]|uniref:L-aminopeptidase DmpA. Serine peptidase. MEROPS family S58 n=1 Tax=Microlunatus soli TaxID=630515 RepID=A0A1H2A756_9ACTN|nr:P1 family peptidase [Microlunatus soli]SDT41800.1 L-aminopeptidase DmpA. Serine peptidase. MEROPS family S58 [Microlunatus soli]
MISSSRPTMYRARDLGVAPGDLAPGPLNAITDVPGVLVGQVTLIEGAAVRTGVTAVLPHGGNLFADKVAGAVHVGNGFGKTAGAIQVNELGCIETPIVLTNTLSVAAGIDGILDWTLAQPGNEEAVSINAIVGETNDSTLNDIRGRHVTAQHVVRAIREATGGPVAEGSVGAGTGTVAFGWKAGIGTSSRIVDGHTLGVLVQTNYGGSLRIDGVPIAPELVPEHDDRRTESGDGSCMIIVGTDAPVDTRTLDRIGARAIFAMARTGSSYSNGSGDIAIAFATGRDRTDRPIPAGPGTAAQQGSDPSPLFRATLDATEEAIYNSLFAATTITGSGGTTRRPIAVQSVRELLARNR